MPAVAMLAGCSGPQDFMRGTGPAAHGLASLGWTVLVTFSAVTVVVWLLIGWIAVRRRGTLAEHAPVDAAGGESWILVGGFGIPLAVLAALFVMALATLAAYPMQDGLPCGTSVCSASGPALVRVTGHQWWFEAQYAFDHPDLDVTSPTEVHIPVGRPVDIDLDTRDVIHSFWVPKLHGKVDMVPGYTNRIRIQADRPGVYFGECGEYCGMQHAHMRLEVVAQEPAQYQAWLASQREPAREPQAEDAKRGRELFLAGPCATCHTVRGTPAGGRLGPDLTHIASRPRIAGGMLDNNTANLEAWITQAQSLKPGSLMPDVTQFSGRELRALVAYLQTLR